MVSSLLPFRTAVGGGGLLDRAATQLFGTSVLRRVRQTAERPAVGARGEKENDKELSIQLGSLAEGFPCTGKCPFLSAGRTRAAVKESCRLLLGLLSLQCSALQREMLLQGSGKPPFPSQPRSSVGMLCSAFRQRCHEHRAAKDQLDTPILRGQHRVQIQCNSKGQW